MSDTSAAEVEAHVRAQDPDRWLSARLLADPAARAAVLALYALDLELARVAGQVSQPLLGEMRFAWWREALEEAAAGAPRAHPVLQAVAPLLRSGRLPAALLERVIEARHADLDTQPFTDEATRIAYLDGAYGAVMEAAATLLQPPAHPRGGGDPGLSGAAAAKTWVPASAGMSGEVVGLVSAGRAWGCAMLLRRTSDEALCEKLRTQGLAALVAARIEIAALPVAAFPAVAHLRLARAYLRDRDPGDLAKRAALLWASATGRI